MKKYLMTQMYYIENNEVKNLRNHVKYQFIIVMNSPKQLLLFFIITLAVCF